MRRSCPDRRHGVSERHDGNIAALQLVTVGYGSRRRVSTGMDIADWIATVVAAWVMLSVPVALIIGKIPAGRDPQIPAVGPGKTAGPELGKRTSVWRSTVAADGRAQHRQVA